MLRTGAAYLFDRPKNTILATEAFSLVFSQSLDLINDYKLGSCMPHLPSFSCLCVFGTAAPTFTGNCEALHMHTMARSYSVRWSVRVSTLRKC